MRLYHFTSAVHGIDNIIKKRLKISLISELNDPFEHMPFALHDKNVRDAIIFVKQNMAKTAGLLCFSRNWSNPVQWGHYADRHKGVCLGFDVPDKYLFKVKYRSTRIEFDPAWVEKENSVPPEILEAMFCTKFSHWKYEQEVRMMVDYDATKKDKGLYFESFGDDIVLREVIVGANSSISRFQLELALKSYTYPVELAKARLAFKTFRIVRQRDRSLW